MTAKELITALEAGARSNYRDRYRQGNIIHLTGPGDVIMTGDLHGNEQNFDKLVRVAQLADNPNRHLILHELLHSGNSPIPDQCHSYRLVSMVARLKEQFPHQVHCLMGNHAMAQITRGEIVKNGQAVVAALNAGLYATYGQNTQHVMQALDRFLMSLPLAARTDNRIWLSHSLPSLRNLVKFDYDIFEKKITLDTLENNSSLRALIWDRVHSSKCLAELQVMWNIDMFIIGHQPQSQGFGRPLKNLFILASDHSKGYYLPFELGKTYTPDDLGCLARPLAAIA